MAYRNKAHGDVVVAVAGTKFTSIRDWQNNASAAMGHVPIQFLQARTFVQSIRDSFGGNEITCTGHSLGGGACAYVAVTSRKGVRAVVVNPITPGYEALRSSDRVDNYVVRGDVARGLYGKLEGRSLIGNVYYVDNMLSHLPSATPLGGVLGNKSRIKASVAILNHGFDRALRLIARQAGVAPPSR